MLEVHSLNDVLSCLLDDVKPIDLSITSNFQMTNYSEEAGCRGYQICMHLSKHTLHTELHFQFRFKLESMDRSRNMFLQKFFSAVLVSSKIQNWYGSQQILIQQQVIYYNMHYFSNLLWHLSKSFKLWKWNILSLFGTCNNINAWKHTEDHISNWFSKVLSWIRRKNHILPNQTCKVIYQSCSSFTKMEE